MAIRINADFQAVYIHEPLGHEVPALNTPWTVAGLFRLEADVNLNTLIVALYGTTAAASWVGLYMNADGITCQLEGYNGGATTTSGSYTLQVGREYHLAIDNDGAGTVRMLLDGVQVLSMAFTPNAGTAGERSLQWGGYGEISGYTDCTIARWRMWTRVLTEAEHRAEYRSTVPVHTNGLIHDWPMVAGSGRFNDTLPGEPDLVDNPLVPVTDGTDFLLRPRPYGTPQFFPLGDSATPGAQTITVPRWAKWVAIFIEATDDTVPDVDTTSVVSDFAGTFTLDNITASATSAGGCIATAAVLSYGAGRTFTITFDAANTLAGAGAWVTFLQDTAASPITDTDHGEASGDGTTPGVASAAGVAGGLAIALDSRLDNVSGAYPANEAGWESLGTGQSGPGGIGYYGATRLRQKAITATGTETATTQTTFASIVSLLTLAPSPALASVAPTAPVVESGDVTNSGNNTASGSWGVACPALVAGDMLLVHIGWDDSTDTTGVTPPAGPNGETATLVAGPVASNGTEVRAAVWRYIATGTWSAGNRTFTPSASEQWTASVLKVPAGEFDAATPTGAASTRSSAGTAETQVLSPAYSVGATDGGGRLVSWLVADDDPFIADATGWTQLANVDRGAVAGLLAARDLETSNSEAVTAGTWRIAGDSWCSLAYVIRKPATGGVTGTLAQTLGALTASAAGTVRASAALSATLGALTASAAGEVRVSGQSAATLGALSLAGAGQVRAAGALAQSLGDLTLAATGVVGSTPIVGTAAILLQSLTATAAGQVRVSGAASNTLGPVTLASAGTVRATGALAATLGPATLNATGVVGTAPITGGLAVTLAPLTSVATAVARITGSLARTLGDVTLTAAGGVRVTGQLSAVLDALQVSASGGGVNVGSASIVLEGLTLSATGTVLTLSQQPSLYVAYVPAPQLRAIVPAENFTAFVPADDVGSAVPEGDYTATV